MEESYLMSDSVTASTFIVTPRGELITFEEYQKTKHATTQNQKLDENTGDRKKAQTFLHDFQHQALSSDTIKNMLRNEDSGVVSKDLMVNCPKFRLELENGVFVKNPIENGGNGVLNGQNGQNGVLNGLNGVSNSQNGVLNGQIGLNGQNGGLNPQNAVSNGDTHVSNLLQELNDENLTTTQHTRADEIHNELLIELSELTNFNSKSQELTGQMEIDLLRHTNMYLTQIQNEVTSLKKKLGGDIAN